MMTKKHKEKIQEEEEVRIAISKSALTRNLRIGVIAVLMASAVVLNRGQLLGALTGKMVTQPSAHLLVGAATTQVKAPDGSDIDDEIDDTSDITTVGDPITGSLPWNLILVNRDHLLPQDFTVDLETIGNQRVDTRIAPAVREMIQDAKSAGIDLTICSAYRSIARQRELYEQKVTNGESQGYDLEKSEAIAEQYTQSPGASEHHTGLALDIITPSYQTLDSGFANTAAFQWLHVNSPKYGFVIRYPEGKEDITGILYEPWHFRYVGVAEANEMLANGECLEEYVAHYGKAMPQAADTGETTDTNEDAAQ